MAAMKKLALFPVILLLVLSLALPASAADKLSATELIALAKAQSPQLRAAIEATFTAKDLHDGTAWAGHGSDFFFAVESATPPSLVIDDFAGSATEQIPGSNLWYASAQIEPVSRMHQFHFLVAGESFGGRLDLPAFSPHSYLQPGTPSGTLSEKLIHTSKIYDGMKSEYWIDVPAQYDPKAPAAVMVFQDGGG
jgi:enterochelin esterase family protein